MPASLNLQHGALNDFGYCWVCDSKDGLHMHHIVPRSYGGENGPQVSVCGGCHTELHDLGVKKVALVARTVQQKRLHLLAQYVRTARANYQIRVSKDRRPLLLSAKLTPEYAVKLKQLKTASGQSSILKTIQWMINDCFNRHTSK